MENSLKCKVDVKMCNTHYDELKEDLTRGSTRFDQLITEQTKIGTTLARLDERIKLLLDRT